MIVLVRAPTPLGLVPEDWRGPPVPFEGPSPTMDSSPRFSHDLNLFTFRSFLEVPLPGRSPLSTPDSLTPHPPHLRPRPSFTPTSVLCTHPRRSTSRVSRVTHGPGGDSRVPVLLRKTNSGVDTTESLSSRSRRRDYLGPGPHVCEKSGQEDRGRTGEDT